MAKPNPFVEWVERFLETPPRLAFGYFITLYGLIFHPSRIFAEREDNLENTLTLPPATFYVLSYGLFLLLTYVTFVVAFGQAPEPLLQSYFGRLVSTLEAFDFANALLLSTPFVAFLIIATLLQKLLIRIGGAEARLIDLLHANFYAHGLALGACSGFWSAAAGYYYFRRLIGAVGDTTKDPTSLLLATLAGLALLAACCIIAASFHLMVMKKVKPHGLADFLILVMNAVMPVGAIVGVTWLFSRPM